MKEFRKLKKFKVLVGVPTNEVKNYYLNEFLSTITNLTYNKGEYDILIADNSKEKKNAKKIMKAGVQSIHIKQKQKDIRQYIADSHEALRVATLKGNYDFLMHIESDIRVPLDIIERLLSHQKQIVAAPYFIDFGHNSHLMVQDIEKEGNIVRHTANIGGGHDIMIMDGQLKTVHSAGLGCILIHKSVLEKINFRYMRGMDMYPDSVFFADCSAQGFKVHLDTSLYCEHYNSSWSNITDNIDTYLKK